MNKDHFLQFNVTLAKKLDLLNVEASSMRPRQYHYINTPAAIDVLFNFYMKFITIKNDDV